MKNYKDFEFLKWFLLVMVCLFMFNVSLIQSKVCYGDIDIRNEPYQLEKLRNCTVVAGSVSILLIEKYHTFNFTIYEFPELKEIEGYLLLHHVNGLKTLKHLFPNLTVIRGEDLLSHYAFILHEMDDLVEIGLKSLVKIQRGLVYIRKCPNLCYADTVSWTNLTQTEDSGWGNHLALESSNECPTKSSCPSCDYCWNNKNCQLFDTGYSYDNKKIKCHQQCLGGCTNTKPSGCNVCRGPKHNGTCVEQCPKDKFLFYKECIDAKYCIAMKRIPFQGECRRDCPPKYRKAFKSSKINQTITVCEMCPVECPKECHMNENETLDDGIDSLAESEMLRGCQIIVGNINIRIQSGIADTMKILERNLGDIEEITGLLRIYRSPTITALSFFRSLRKIRGISLESNKYTYSFIIRSNENLQKIWDYNEKKEFQLLNGNLLVHFNSKLCLSEIHALQTFLKTNQSEDFIGLESNGYEESCTARVISSSAVVNSPSNVTIRWQPFEISDVQKMIGYTIYYIEAPERNITHMGIDSCVRYGWKTYFFQKLTLEKNSNYYQTNLNNLAQYTQYAFYVKTQVVLKDHENDVLKVVQGQSEIKYFTTLAKVPTAPVVETKSKTNTTIFISWYPSVLEKELIEYYQVNLFIQPDLHDVLDSRNYCIYQREYVQVSDVVSHSFDKKENCSSTLKDSFESRIQNKTYCAKHRAEMTKYFENKELNGCQQDDKQCNEEHINNDRFTRGIHDLIRLHGDANLELETPKELISEIVESQHFLYSRTFGPTAYNATIDGLLPYTLYTMQFFACNSINCSLYFMHNERTDSSVYADNVQLIVSLDPTIANTVHLDFSEPKTPNGLTVAFQIDKNDLGTLSITTTCITRKQHYDNQQRYTFTNLKQGKYGFRIRSISLAMSGTYTDYEYINVVNSISLQMKLFIIFLVVCIVAACVATMIYVCSKIQERRHISMMSGSRQNIIMAEHFPGVRDQRDDEPFDIAEDSF